MTAFARPKVRTRALVAGYQAHIAKPAEVGEIAATIRSILSMADPQ